MKRVHNQRFERPESYRYVMERPVDKLGSYIYGVEIKREWPRGRQAMELRRARYILQRRVEELRNEITFGNGHPGIISRAVHDSKPISYRKLEGK